MPKKVVKRLPRVTFPVERFVIEDIATGKKIRNFWYPPLYSWKTIANMDARHLRAYRLLIMRWLRRWRRTGVFRDKMYGDVHRVKMDLDEFKP